MYNEKEDFETHQKDVDDFIVLCKHFKIDFFDKKIVLDLGADRGMHAGILTSYFDKVYCSDIINYSSLAHGEFLKLLNEKHLRNGVPCNLKKMHFIETDAMDLIYKDDLFDFVFSINVFEHIPNPDKAVKEIIRITKPNGYIYIRFDPIWTADTGSHFFHIVPEPWGHLIYSDEVFNKIMRNNGANDNECNEYIYAMNRKRLNEFLEIFEYYRENNNYDIIYHTSWAGVIDEKHIKHQNFYELQNKGFTEKELLTRGLVFLLKINKNS